MSDTPSARQAHWDGVYTARPEEALTWFEPEPGPSLALLAGCGLSPDAKVIDVGGGASRLVDALLDRGFDDLTVLDLSPAALARSQARLGARAQKVRWIAADITRFAPTARYALWHDRAVFHFLTEAADRAAYVDVLQRAVAPGGSVLVGTFAPDGPTRCSGLDVVRYDAPGLAAALGPAFSLAESLTHDHPTPAGRVQRFTFVRLTRV